MRTYDLISISNLLKEKEITFFTVSDLKRLLGMNNQNSLYKKIKRLKEKNIIKSLNKGHYYYPSEKINDFSIGNFLYHPSYISLETALSLYSIITAFPYKITSTTIKRTKAYFLENKEYSYTQITKNLFWGYEKREDYLMAIPEKALLDYLYLCARGLRSFDKEEFDLTKIDKRIFNKFIEKMDLRTKKYLYKIKIC